MSFSCRYLALYVPELEAAETFFRRAFDMDLLFRECEVGDGWATVRPGLDWPQIAERGLVVDMVALERDGFVLALFRGDPRPGTIFEICMGVQSSDEIDAIRARLPGEATVEEHAAGWLRFADPFGFRWAVRDDASAFRSSGEIAGRWLE